MNAKFSQTIRSFNRNQRKTSWNWAWLSLGIITAWGTWFFLGQVRVYEVSENALIETSVQARPITTLTTGRVSQNQLQLGQIVKQGQLLVQLDDRVPQLAALESQSRIDALDAQIEAIAAEINSAEDALTSQVTLGNTAVRQLKARIDDAQAQHELATSVANRSKKLIVANAISQSEHERALSVVRSKLSSLRALQLSIEQLQAENTVDIRDRLARIAQLKREQVELQGQLQTERSALRRLNQTIEEYRVVAPAEGKIGHISQYPAGSVIPAGTVLASVVPASQLRAVGYFPVSSSGRIATGQTARLKLEGFDWTEFGHVATTVTEVAIEPESELLRVEFLLDSLADHNIPVQHGLTGIAEVQVESVSPATLTLRRIGVLFRRHDGR